LPFAQKIRVLSAIGFMRQASGAAIEKGIHAEMFILFLFRNNVA